MARSPLQHAQHLAAAGRIAEAERACREALATRPNDPQALRLRAQLARHPDNPAPNPAESVRIFQQLRQARPGDLQLAGELGASLTAAGQAAQAYPLLKQAVTAMPSNPAWHLWLGRCLLRLFKPQAAIAALREARRLDPGSTDALLPLAGALIQSAQPERAEPVVREYLATHPGSLPARTTLAEVFEHRGRLDDAIAECRTVLEKHPAHGGTLGILARCLHAKGLTDEAARALEPLVSGPDLSPSGVIALAPIYLAQKRSAECRDLCERALRTDALATPLRSSLLSVLALARQNLGEFDAAFEAFAEAKACLPRTFNRERHAARYDAIRAAFPPERTAAGSAARGGRCVFIVGMPRTGTTLLEQILDAHPSVFGAGELSEIPAIVQDLSAETGRPAPGCLAELTTVQLDGAAERYLAFLDTLPHGGAERIVDKLPHNFEHLGFIARALPGAQIIHASRNPIDTCLSCFTTQLSAWHSYANDLTDLAFAYAQYQRLMAHWRDECRIPMLEVRYEDTVADLESQARRVIAHLGLNWDDRCLAFHQSARTITTASVDQVRSPIYTSSVDRWRRYERQLGPLIEALRGFGVNG